MDDFTGQYVVLFFYPLNFTDLCESEILAFNNKAKEFAEHECQLISCSVDSHFTHKEFTKTAIEGDDEF